MYLPLWGIVGLDKETLLNLEHKWNWGAALMPFRFGIGCKAYLCLISLIPLVNLFWWIVCGKYGSRWASKSKMYDSPESFYLVMNTWNRAGKATFIYMIALLLMLIATWSLLETIVISIISAQLGNIATAKVRDALIAAIKSLIF